MNALTIIRTYLGLTQAALATAANVSHPKLCHMEKEAFGRVGKYCRVADALGLPVEPILKDDFGAIPPAFFDTHPPQPYLPSPTENALLVGRQGEDFIFTREQQRLSKFLPIHAKLVLPLYKMKSQRIGCDILSYDDDGKPICLEVKTTASNSQSFSITKNELLMAQKFSAEGIPYYIIFINNWGTSHQTVQDIPFEEFLQNYDTEAMRYHCTPKKDPARTSTTGLAHFRKLRKMTEHDLAETLGIRQHKWSIYETGARVPPVSVLLRASELLGATVDELLAEYPFT